MVDTLLQVTAPAPALVPVKSVSGTCPTTTQSTDAKHYPSTVPKLPPLLSVETAAAPAAASNLPMPALKASAGSLLPVEQAAAKMATSEVPAVSGKDAASVSASVPATAKSKDSVIVIED